MRKAINNNDIPIIKLLLERGARVDPGDYWGTTSLYLAVWHGYDKVVELLLSKGARPDAAVIELEKNKCRVLKEL